MTFACRIRVLLRQGYLITQLPQGEDSFKVQFRVDERMLFLEVSEGKTLRDSQNLVITAKEFATEMEAWEYGQRIKKAFLLFGVSTKLAIDIGKDKPENDDFVMGGLLNDIHGVLVYDQINESLILVSGGGSSALGVSAGIFAKEFVSAFALTQKLNEKQTLAIELYNSAHFELSSRAQFLTLIYAVECLIERARQPDIVVNYVQEFYDITQKKLKDGDLSSLTFDGFLDRLRDLKQESINQACKSLVSKYLGDQDARLFTQHYKTRSRLVHEGKAPEGTELRNELPQLDSLVSRLINAIVTSS